MPVAQMTGLTVRLPNPREIYEGCQTETNSSGLARSSGSAATPTIPATRRCQEVYEGIQRSPDSTSVSVASDDGYEAAGEHSSRRKFKGILGRLLPACFKPWKNVNSPPKTRASPGATEGQTRVDILRSNGRMDSGGHTYIGPQRCSQGEKRELFFTIDEIRRATENFSTSHRIGQGDSGTVYMARLDDGTFVAVKCAKKDINDERLSLKIQGEVQSLLLIRHFNLVKILGYLEHQGERMLIVEYVQNGNLREHLDGIHGITLNLADRIDLALDVAHAVTFLHMQDHPIMHQKIKSSNILLTENFRAKVTDFWSACKTYKGVAYVEETAGYLAPEYLRNDQLTVKSDVYSFGVLLVELISGRQLVEPEKQPNEQTTITWAMKTFAEGDAIEVLDPKLQRTPATDLALEKILELALKCLCPSSQDRPSMWTCADILWGIRKDYRELSGMEVRTPL